jgi:hypothetical protein
MPHILRVWSGRCRFRFRLSPASSLGLCHGRVVAMWKFEAWGFVWWWDRHIGVGRSGQKYLLEFGSGGRVASGGLVNSFHIYTLHAKS